MIADVVRKNRVYNAVLFIIAFAFLSIGANSRPMQYDELYHVLAAQSWSVLGDLSIANGQYMRARLYTLVTGMAIDAFGWSPLVSRLPAIMAGALLVAALFAWVRAVAGFRAGCIAAVLLCFSHPMIENAQFARFYTLHALAVWLCAATGYALLTRWKNLGGGQRAVGIIAALLLLGLAFHLQPTTVIAAFALIMALILRADLGRLISRVVSRRWIVPVIAAGLAALIILGWDGFRAGFRLYMTGAAWSVETANRPGFYYGVLTQELGWMFSLLPVAVLAAWTRRPPAVTFCASFVLLALILHSFAAMKAERYIFYVLPFLFAIWGIAIDSAWRALAGLIRQKWPAVAPRWKIAMVAALSVALPMGLVGIFAYRATASELLMLATGGSVGLVDADPRNEDVDWAPFLTTLRDVSRTEMFVTADDLRALHYLDGYDLLLNLTVVRDYSDGEFERDPRTGGYGITTAASLASIMQCYDSGTVLVSNRRWRSTDVTNDVADFIEKHMNRVALPEGLRMRAYVWRSPAATGPRSTACQAVRHRIGDDDPRRRGRLVKLTGIKRGEL